MEAGQALAHQSRPGLRPNKNRRDRLIQRIPQHPSWALGWADEVGWSRLAPPNQHGWADPEAVPKLHALVRHPLRPRQQVWLRFVEGRPVSAVTTAFLAWGSDRVAAQGVTALIVSWDNASWHISQEGRAWLRAHHHTVKRTGPGVRIVPCRLPTNSPGLHPIEPKWVHGKRAVSDPERRLRAADLEARV